MKTDDTNIYDQNIHFDKDCMASIFIFYLWY